MESAIKKAIGVLILLLLAAISTAVQAGTITITSPTRNITAEFRGGLIMQSPTINVTVNGKKFSMTVNEMISIRDIGNTVITPGPMGQVHFSISVQN